MTSNLGSEEVVKQGKIDDGVKNVIREKVFSYFRPELLNRINSIVLFNPIGKEMAKEIVKKELASVQQLLSPFELTLSYKDDVIDYLIEKGFDPIFGARPLKRLIEEEIVDEIASLRLEEKIKNGDKVKISVGKKGLEIGKE